MEKNEILILHGKDPARMARTLAEQADLAALIGGAEKRVGLKPNLVLGRPASEGATTHPEVLAGLIEYLQARGHKNIAIMEGAWVGARTADAFRACGYDALAKKYGVPLIDLQKDSAKSHDCAGMRIDLCDAAMAVDFMVNLPVMKGHCQTVLTCALKNNKGVITGAEKRRFHSMGLHKPIAHLNTVAKNDFILVDAICGDLDFEEGGNPIQSDMMFAARDPVLCDAFAAGQMGIALSEVPYIAMAQGLGVGSSDVTGAKITRLNEGKSGGTAPRPTGRARQLAQYIKEDGACSACTAALVRALSRADGRTLAKLTQPVCVGQGFAGKGGALGAGRCTAGFEKTVAGCPPSAADILAVLEGR